MSSTCNLNSIRFGFSKALVSRALVLSRSLNPYLDTLTSFALRALILRILPLDILSYVCFGLFYTRQLLVSLRLRNAGCLIDFGHIEKLWFCTYSNVAPDGSVLRLPDAWISDDATMLIPVAPYDKVTALFKKTKERNRNCFLFTGVPRSFLGSLGRFKRVWKATIDLASRESSFSAFHEIKLGLIIDCCQFVWYREAFGSNEEFISSLVQTRVVHFSFEFQPVELALLDLLYAFDQSRKTIRGYSASVVRSMDNRYSDWMVETYRQLGIDQIYINTKFNFQKPRRFSLGLGSFFVHDPAYARQVADLGSELNFQPGSQRILVMASLNFFETRKFIEVITESSSLACFTFLIKFHPADAKGKKLVSAMKLTEGNSIDDVSFWDLSDIGPVGAIIGVGDTSSICNFREFSGPYLSFCTSRKLSTVAFNPFFYEVSDLDELGTMLGKLENLVSVKNQFKNFWKNTSVCP